MGGCLKIDTIISNYFKAENYANDNLPDVLYWYVKRLITIYVLMLPISEQDKRLDRLKFSAFHELFRIALDALFVSGRQFFGVKESYSGGRLLSDLNRDKNLGFHLEKTYDIFIRPEQQKLVGQFCKEVPKVHNKLYSYAKGANYTKSIHEYQKENFHQDRHDNGEKYDIIRYDNLSIMRRNKPVIELDVICEEIEALSSIILSFAKICVFYYGNILGKCNRFHDNTKKMIEMAASIYNYSYTEKMIEWIKQKIENKIPTALEVISRDIYLS